LDLAMPGTRRWASDAHHAAAAGEGVSISGNFQPKIANAPVPAAPEVWIPPIVSTVATDGRGAEDLAAALDRHRAFLQNSGGLAQRERERLAHELETRLRERLLQGLTQRLGPDALAAAVERLLAREIDPAGAAKALAEKII
jgi:putative protein kinase ArgK-like GTPase of G3E family